MSTAHTRTVASRELPAPGKWVIDPSHSDIQVVARHMMISKVRGHFREFSGVIAIADEPELSEVDVTIVAASVDTGDPDRDRHLRSPEFLDVEAYPEILFRSTSTSPRGDKWDVVGDLTIRNVTRSVTLEVEFCGVAMDPWNNVRAAFLATTEINREDFDITWNQALEAGGFLVGKGVKVEIDIEAVREADSAS